jgi:hypothetical protein
MQPLTQLEIFSHCLKRTSSLASKVSRFERHWATLVCFSREQIPASNITKATWGCSWRRMV